jgi:hypothetical protein
MMEAIDFAARAADEMSLHNESRKWHLNEGKETFISYIKTTSHSFCEVIAIAFQSARNYSIYKKRHIKRKK